MFRNRAATDGVTTAMQVKGIFRVQTKFPDGAEKVEEWTAIMNRSKSKPAEELVLLSRKWRESKKTSILGRGTPWEFEIGSDLPTGSTSSTAEMSVNGNNPKFEMERCHDGDRDRIVWKVSQCPWPLDNYSVTVDDRNQELVLRTSNRRFFKRFKAPSLVRLGLQLDKSRIELKHDSNNCLFISYLKPNEVREAEINEMKEAVKAVARIKQDGDVDCKQS